MSESKIISESKIKSEIQTTLEKNYKDNEFIRLMRESVTDNIKNNEFYSDMVKGAGFRVDDLNNIEDLASIPMIPTTFYKQSANKFRKLLKIPEEEVQQWNCSSTTSGDPSLVGINKMDLDFLSEMSKKCFLEFIPRDWNNAIVYIFAPNPKLLDRFCIRYTKVRPVRAYSGNYFKASEEMSKVEYLFSFSFLKAIQAIIKTRSIVGGFYIKENYLLKKINENHEKPENERYDTGIGGSIHLINKFMEHMKENGIKFDLKEKIEVVTGGGGWDGHKAQLKYDPINKSKFVSDISELFGTEKKQVIDIYGLTESPIVFGSHWSEKYQDYVFHCPQYARIIIRNTASLEPLKNEGERGILEILTPFGSNASIKHAIVVDDQVELVSKNRCSECGKEGATFRVLGRLDKSEGLGCSSLISWI